MFSLECTHCGGDLIVDIAATSEAYYEGANYLVDSEGEIIERTIQNYLFYRCGLCNNVYKYTYKDWEESMRKKIAKDVMAIKKIEMFKNINPASVNADNGLSYCGQCSGYAGDGYCLNDIVKQCTIRKI